MTDQIPKRVHILPIARAHERIVQIFSHQMPDRVYVLYNEDPLEAHNEVNQVNLEEVISLVEEKTMCREEKGILKQGIDFYRFDSALVESFETIYREERLHGNKVYVNVSGGTKPLAIALWAACALSESAEPLYYPAEKYERQDDGSVSSHGVAGSFRVATHQLLQMADILPDKEGEHDIMTYLLESDHSIGVTDLLISLGKITKTASNEEERSERSSTVQRYHRYANNLDDAGILEQEGTEYRLTESGKLIAKLVRTKNQIDREAQEHKPLDDFFE